VRKSDHLLETKTTKAGDVILKAGLYDKRGFYYDGHGLYLQVQDLGQKSWSYRYKQTWRSLGSANVFIIEEARAIAAKLWKAARRGEDAIALLDTMRETAGANPAGVTGKTFAEAMAIYLKAKSPYYADSNRKRELRRYEFLFDQIPWFVALPVKAIDQDAKNKALAHWDGQAKKRSDVGYYINAILHYDATGELRGINKAATAAVVHHEAMPYGDVPAFYARLPDRVDANALRFLILTGVRASELIGAKHKAPATWGEIVKVEGKPTWVIPANRMKAKQIHRVPLSREAVALLGKPQGDKVPLFKASNDGALLKILKANDGNGFVVHGFRASLQEWGTTTTKYPADLIDMCIAHDGRGSVTKAYQRSDRLAERRPILQEWSGFVAG
jgi:integrase